MGRQGLIEKLMEALDQATSLFALQEVITDLRDHYDVLHTVDHWVDSGGEQYGCGTYLGDWVDHYLEQGYLWEDPVILGCFQRFHPVDCDWRLSGILCPCVVVACPHRGIRFDC